MKNRIVFFLMLLSQWIYAQQLIEHKWVDDFQNFKERYWDYVDDDFKKTVSDLANQKSDSMVFYFDGFNMGTEISISNNYVSYTLTCKKHYLNHNNFTDFVVVDKDLFSSLPVLIEFKFYSKKELVDNYNYSIKINDVNDFLNEIKSIVVDVSINENSNKKYVKLGHSSVDKKKLKKLLDKYFKDKEKKIHH